MKVAHSCLRSNFGADRTTARTRLCLFAILLALLHGLGCQRTVSLEEVRKLQSGRQYAQSLVPLRNRIEAGSKDPEVFYLYGLALSWTGERDAALWPLRKAMESPEWIVAAGMQLASDAFAAKNNDTALATLNQVLEVEPDHVLALVLRARARIETRRNLEQALADADRALALDPDLSRARVARVVALLALKRVEEAGAALEEIEEFAYEADLDDPESARFCGARASFAKEKGEAEKADERYTKCLEQFPSSPILVAAALKFYEGRGEVERAVEILETALADAPESRDYRVGLALRQATAGKLDRAEQLLREGTESENRSLAAGAWIDLAGYLIDREQLEAGVEAMEKVFELNSRPSPQLVFRYADTLLAAQRFDDALALLDRLTVPAHRHLVRGRVHLARGEFALAVEEMSAGLSAWPENAVARYYAALAAEGVGNFDGSIEELRYSIRSGPDQTDARLRLAKLHYAEGAYKQAIAMLRQDVMSHPPGQEMAELELELIARLGGKLVIPPHLSRIVNRPGGWQRAIVSLARGSGLRSGPEAAIEFIAGVGADLSDPANALLLKEQTRYLADAERAGAGVALAEKSLLANPDAADFQAILGLALLRNLSPNPSETERVRSALDRALALEPEHPDALVGLGQLAQIRGDAAAALDFYLRADAANPSESRAIEAVVDVLIALGRPDDAEKRLEELLERDPYSGRAALRLLELRVARGAAREDRSRVLARLAVRFGAAAPVAVDLLKRKRSR